MNNEKRLDSNLLPIALLILFVIILLRTAWVSDDAYITLRTISNFARGQGLTWNVGERVQSYTHPLWLVTLGIGIFFSKEFHLTTMFISIAISALAFLLLTLRLANPETNTVLGASILILSKSFIDYSTSGLENPLGNLLLVLFSIALLRYHGSRRGLFVLGLLASLAFLTRPDYILVFYPALTAAFLLARSRKHLATMLLSQIPVLVWEGFSLLYYGVAVPNTALAKLNVGIPVAQLVEQGWLYLLDSLQRDPITLAAILLGLASVILLRSWKWTALAFGILLHLAYVIRIGGDFMSGRFLSLPLLAGVILLSQVNFSQTSLVVLLGAFSILGLASPYPTIFSGQDYGQDEGQRAELFSGVTDERGFYYPDTGLLREDRILDLPRHSWVYEGMAAHAGDVSFMVRDTIGFFGFYAGPEIHIVDYYGLADPLLSHLPALPTVAWRIGHFLRDIPVGYLESLKSGTNLIEDPSLAKFYDAIRLVTHDRLFAPGRLAAIWKLNTGGYHQLLDDYMQAKYKTVDALDLMPSGRPGDSSAPIRFTETGIKLIFDEPQFGTRITATVSNRADYSLLYFLEGEELGRQVLSVWSNPEGAALEASLIVPSSVQQRGFDCILIIPDEFGSYELDSFAVE